MFKKMTFEVNIWIVFYHFWWNFVLKFTDEKLIVKS